MNELAFETYLAASPLFERDILYLDVDSALAARDIPGATAPNQVRKAAQQLREALGG